MILNRQRLFLFFAIVAMALFSASCVEIPSEGVTPPNYQSSVKYFHAGRGTDTISFTISSITYAKNDSTIVYTLSGTDSVKTTSRFASEVSVKRFRRYDVNFGQPLELYVDGSLRATLPFGTATNYFTTSSGSRKIELKGNGTWVDSLRVTKIDTVVSISRDTIRNGVVIGKSSFDTTVGGTFYNFIPVTGVSKVTVDSTILSVESERQLSLLFVGDTIANQNSEGNYVRYGRIRYVSAFERKLFEPAGKVDSALIRINNNFPVPINVLRATSTTNATVGTVNFRATLANTPYRARVDTTYKFYFTNSANAIFDSVSLNVSKGKQYSISVLDSAGVRIVRAFNH